MKQLSILYRGPLSSCNYGCTYCPFAKRKESRADHARDAAALARFVEWVAEQREMEIGVLFTPWGEALIRKRYQQALATLTHLPHVVKAAIQTNLDCRLEWVEECDKAKLALWATYHPTQTSRARFLAQCEEALSRGVRFSVGVVGLQEHFEEIEALRAALPNDVYLWVNAYKREPNYYDEGMLDFLTTVDPLFPYNTHYHPSAGKACRGGEQVISVDGDGTMRRCHFIKTPIGNIYDADYRAALQPRPCTNATCGCHIGYVHLDELKLYEVYGDGVLERIPAGY
jgi:MoaA/NifB/PqqE/SkfB family radical SAM enzyme